MKSRSQDRGSLLTHVVTTVGRRQAENLTTAALLYVLEKYPPARRAFIDLLMAAAGIDLPYDLWFQFQASRGAARIPDVAAIDDQNRERVLIEVKLTAGFGAEQARDYFERLSQSEPSALCILAPSRRIPLLWLDAHRQIENLIDSNRDSSRRAVRGTRVLCAISWNDLLNTLEAALASSPEGSAEIAQLRGVSEYYDRREFLPFSSDDLSASFGLLVQQISDLIDQAHQVCLEEGLIADSRLTAGAERGIYYGYSGNIAGWPAWVGLWTAAWLELAETPFWLQFYDKAVVGGGRAAQVLRPLETPGLPTVFYRESEQDVAVALYPPFGASEEQTVLGLVDGIRQAHRCIEDAPG